MVVSKQNGHQEVKIPLPAPGTRVPLNRDPSYSFLESERLKIPYPKIFENVIFLHINISYFRIFHCDPLIPPYT